MKDIPFLLPGDTVRNTYRIEKLLGSGSFGQVYLVRHQYLGQQAMKLFTSVSIDRPLNDALSEARTLVDLSHPNIVRVYDANLDSLNGTPFAFITMEWCTLGTVQDQLKRARPWSLDTTIKMGIDVCAALSHTHSKNPPLLHLDVKPANLLIVDVKPDIHVKLTDYGLAAHLNPITRLAKSGGTLAFAAPEMAWGVLDERADIYSLGVTLYRAICGTHPFPIQPNDPISSSSNFRILLANGRKDITAPSKILLRQLPLLDDVLLKALAYDPFDRYRNVNEFAIALQTVAAQYLDRG